MQDVDEDMNDLIFAGRGGHVAAGTETAGTPAKLAGTVIASVA